METAMPDDIRAEKISRAKLLYNQGTRNLAVQCYGKAVDEFSEACSILEEVHGELSDELGLPYLHYAKSLIGLALEDSQIIDVKEKENSVDEDEGEEERDENEDEEEDDDEDEDESGPNEQKRPENGTGTTNGKPSSTNTTKDKDAEGKEEPENVEEISNLELAWQILELASVIFKKQGEKGWPPLAEVYSELGNIEFENGEFSSAEGDYEKALFLYSNIKESHRRSKAAIYYKIGLMDILQEEGESAIDNFKTAIDLLRDEINAVKTSLVNTGPEDNFTITDMEATIEEIKAKILEVQETTPLDNANAKEELNKLISQPNTPANQSKPSSTSHATNITHLIKRKKDVGSNNKDDPTTGVSPTKRNKNASSHN